MIERRAKGLRYYCDEKYSPEHYLKHKTQLFMLEGEEMVEEIEEVLRDEEVDDTEGTIAHISVNAISGETTYTTMRVRGLHGKRMYMCSLIQAPHITSLTSVLQICWDVS